MDHSIISSTLSGEHLVAFSAELNHLPMLTILVPLVDPVDLHLEKSVIEYVMWEQMKSDSIPETAAPYF